MSKKIISSLLSLSLIVSMVLHATAAAPAPKAETFQDKVNAMTLEPLKPRYWDQSFIKRVEAAVKGKKTNYDKLVAVYDYVRTNATDKKLMDGNVFAYTNQLQCALEVIGFRTYNVLGKLASKEDWTHNWVGIDVSNGMYYFDVSSPVLYGTAVSKCFGIPYQKAPLYKNANIRQMEMSPVTTKGGIMNWALAGTNGIPNSVSKRKPYRSVPDKCHPPSLYYAANNGYWLMTDDTETPILDTDKEGNKFIFHPDGTRESYKKAS